LLLTDDTAGTAHAHRTRAATVPSCETQCDF